MQPKWSEGTKWFNQPKTVVTGNNIYVGEVSTGEGFASTMVMPPADEKTPLDWLREQVEETCALAVAP